MLEKTNCRPVFRIVTGRPVPPVTRLLANGSTGDLDGEPEVRKYNRFNPRHAAEEIRGVNLVSASCSHWKTLVEQNELSEFETYPVIKALASLTLGTAHIDVGRIAVAYETEGRAQGLSVKKYVKRQVAALIGSNAKPISEPRDVVLYGFGHIGRLMARLLVEKADGGDTLRLRAIVVRKTGAANDLIKRAALLRSQRSRQGAPAVTGQTYRQRNSGADAECVHGHPASDSGAAARHGRKTE